MKTPAARRPVALVSPATISDFYVASQGETLLYKGESVADARDAARKAAKPGSPAYVWDYIGRGDYQLHRVFDGWAVAS